MRPTTLNLIAITIFVLTMSSLLGPLIHLSPVVPAIVVAGMLGIATLDTLGWQGRGGNLLIDWLAGADAKYRDRILKHEAGHFLVAYLLDVPILSYTLTAWEAFKQGIPGVGGVIFDCQELEQELAQGKLSTQLLNRYCQVWMAGVAAEALTYGSAAGGADDRQKIRTLWLQLQKPLAECQLKQSWSALQARNLLQTHQEAYAALVTSMQNRASVAECYQVIEQSKTTTDC
ncbi:MAG: ATP-dependent Zn protease [Cyanothece sp. SIO1E1]|nr:ATP-dependent Zn protease [Cyanothece sp. SIO1E1]